MSEAQVQSEAFCAAELRSERIRILGVSGFIAALVGVAIVRVFVIRTAPAEFPFAWSCLAAVGILGYEYWTLLKVDAAIKTNGSLPTQFWVASTILETCIPAFEVVFLTSPRIDLAYRPLASPAVLIFFIFIILSTLRLRASISVLAGVVASVAYLGAAAYLGWRVPVPGTPALATQSAVSLNAILLFLGGLVAGGVAREIRKHVQAALREAENKQKLEAIQHDLQVARDIQQSLLPQQAPKITGFEIAGWNRPATDTGGDYFDWKILSNGRVIVSLADVTGHGIGPALLAAVCHAYARSSFSTAQDLRTAFERINHELGADLSPGRFVTFVAAVCCPECADVEILSAGHGPVFVYSRSQQQFTVMNTQGLPFGILPGFQSDPPARYRLESGDLILLSTDGFFEWENEHGEQFGVLRMQEVIGSSRDLAPAQIIAGLVENVRVFAGGTKQQDDLTAVVIKRS